MYDVVWRRSQCGRHGQLGDMTSGRMRQMTKKKRISAIWRPYNS